MILNVYGADIMCFCVCVCFEYISVVGARVLCKRARVGVRANSAPHRRNFTYFTSCNWNWERSLTTNIHSLFKFGGEKKKKKNTSNKQREIEQQMEPLVEPQLAKIL